MTKKKKVLAWSDAAVAGTGFGVVSKHILSALHATGRYEIDHLAINFYGDFVSKKEIPWQMQPAKLLDPRDPHGIKMFSRTLMKKEYDIVWVLNDLYVTKEVADVLTKVCSAAMSAGKKPPTFVYYYPVDCHVQKQACGFLEKVDIPVCYTQHGLKETLKTMPDMKSRIVEIPHGVDTLNFSPLSSEDIVQIKKHYFSMDPNIFLVVQVNRNSHRKQIPYSMLAFKKFKERVPKAVMYLHTMVRDQGADLIATMNDLGLSIKTDIVFPVGYSPANPAPDKILNQFYNCGDLFLTTHLGEGWGLTVTEAMAAGTPVVAPNNTCMPQQLGMNSERGYMYECKDWQWIDSSGFRPKGNLDDIVEKMMQVYRAGPKQANPIVQAARAWALNHDWALVSKKWVELFDNIKEKDVSNFVVTHEV